MISVIVPVYKVEPYLSKCIDSIINQTYKDLEIILVDDGSPDNSGKICDDYAKKDRRIKVIHKQNGGLSSARNVGLDIATGDYIGFVDSDDYIDCSMYEKMLARLKIENADVCVCSFKYVDINGNVIADAPKSPIKLETFDNIEALQKICTTADNSFYYVIACNKLYKRSVFDNLRFEKGRLHEDEFIVHHVYGKCETITTIPDELYSYVQVNGSIMNSPYSIKKLDAAYAYYDRYLYAKNVVGVTNSKESLYVCYGRVLEALEKLSYKKNKAKFNPILKKLMFNFNLGLRCIKLHIAFLKRYFKDTFGEKHN